MSSDKMQGLFFHRNLSSLVVPRVILSDWDDTLFNNEHFMEIALYNVAKKNPKVLKKEFAVFAGDGHLRQIVHDAVIEFAGFPLALMFDKLLNKAAKNEDFEEKALKEYASIKKKTPNWLCDGTMPFLKEVKRRKIPMGLVSNKERAKVVSETDHDGLTGGFFSILGIDSVPEKKCKPNPYPINLSLSKIGYKGDKSDVWFIGDSLTDMKAAIGAGCVPVYVGRLSGLDADALTKLDNGRMLYCANIGVLASLLVGMKNEKRAAV